VTIRAIVFDFDGVIANSEPLHFAAFRDVLGSEGVALTTEDYYARYLGYDDLGVFRALAKDRRVPWSAERIADLAGRKASRLEALERDAPVLFPGAAAVIRRTGAVLPLAIASGALRAEIVRVLEAADLARYFAAVVAAEDTARGKPAPDPYLRAVALLGDATGQPLLAHECVAVEDSRWGLESARAAGLRTIGVTHTYSAGELGPADLLIDSLDALQLAKLRDFDAA
jgi:HAD superfamily hydrolase (TIGR01509 family)